MTGFTVCLISFFRIFLGGNYGMACSYWPCIFFKHAEGVLRPELWQWCKDKALSAM